MKKIVLSLLMSACAALAFSAEIEIGFSPGGTALSLVLKVIASARSTLDVEAYEFTSKPIAAALADAVSRGVKVRLIMDEKESKGKYNMGRWLAQRHAQVFTDGKYPIYHDKVLVADDNTIETGSFNFTIGATKNAENCLVLWDRPDLAAVYEKEFARMTSSGELNPLGLE